MKSTKKTKLRCAVFLALAVICLWGWRLPARAAEPPAIEVGLPQDGLFGLGGQYILDRGLDRKNGFVMKPRWAGVSDIERLLAIGAISVGLATSEAAVRANLQGISIRLISPFQEPHQQFLVRKDSPYKTVEDLKGKAVAITPEVTSLYNMFDFIMKKRGINIEKDFQLKKIAAPAAIIAVMEKGDVEGALLWEAHASRLVATGKYNVIMLLRDEMRKSLNAPVKLMGWIGALDPWVKSNPDMIPRFRAAWSEMIKGAQKDESHFRKYAKQFFGLEKPEEVTLAWQRTARFLLPADFAWPESSNLNAEKTYLKEGMAMGIFPKEAAALIDQLFVP